jgi:hypothetical protein
MRRPSQSGGIIGILMGLFALGAIGLACLFFFGLFIAQNIHVEHVRTRDGETVRVETPVGSMKVRAHERLDPKMAGVPVYPGAIREDHEHNAASFEFDADDMHKEFTVLSAEYSTNDSVERVRDFYRQELPHWIVSKSRRARFQMEHTEHGYKRFVSISDRHGRTHIALASVGEPAAN